MIYKDIVYGTFEIEDPVILELISSKPVLRLKHITQHGATVYNRYFKERVITRFEHSLGVYLFLKKFNCSLEEQIAGLLHDVGHAVFSHVADLLFPHDESSYDDRSQKNVIRSSDIPTIFKKYNLDLEYVLNKDNFPILEKSLPDLCADRIDYFFRDINLVKKTDSYKFINDMKKVNNTIVFGTSKIGLDFAEKYFNMDKTFWADNFQEFLYAVLAEIITIAMRQGVLSLKDLHTKEDDVMDILMLSENNRIVDLLEILLNSKPSDIEVSKVKKDGFYKIKSKVRVVDPYVVLDSKILRVSEIFPNFKAEMEKYKKEMFEPVWIGIEN